LNARILLIVLLLMSSSLSAAQIDPCFGLSEEDCAFIGSASENTLTHLDSFTHTFSLTIHLSGLEAAGLGQDIDLSVRGNGTFARSEDGIIPAEISLSIAGTVNSGDTTDEGVFKLVLIEDVLYIQQDEAAWQRIAIEDLLQNPMFSGENLPQNFNTGLESFAALIRAPGFIQQERLAEEESRVPFRLFLDFAPLFASVEFQNALEDTLGLAGQFDPNLESTAMVAPLLLQDSDLKINFTRYVRNNLIESLILTADGSVDLNPLLGTTEANRLAPITLQIDFSMDLTNFNEPIPLTAPEVGLE
jgi:hypothetical protein